MKIQKLILTWVMALCAMFIANSAVLALEPPLLESTAFNVSYDFLQDLALDDVDIIWRPAVGAQDYKVMIHYTGSPANEYMDEFVIPREQIIDLGNGSLKFSWVDYATNHPRPVAWAIDSIALKAIDSQGNESAPSNQKSVPPSLRTIIYGQITDSATGAPIPNARIDYRQWDPNNYGEDDHWVNEGFTLTDNDGMHYIIGLDYVLSAGGAEGDTRLDISKDGYERSLDNQVTLNSNTRIVRKDIALNAPPAAPSNLLAPAVTSSQAQLTWADNSNNEESFKIERKSAGGSYALIATVSANTTQYVNNGLVRGKRYYYRLRASNSAGNSAYSNVANVLAP